MDTGFKNPIAPKPKKKIKAPWNFECPPYDQRTSCYTSAGSHYGVGHKQPVGHVGNPKQKVDTLPFGRVKTMQVSQVPKAPLPLDIEQ